MCFKEACLRDLLQKRLMFNVNLNLKMVKMYRMNSSFLIEHPKGIPSRHFINICFYKW